MTSLTPADETALRALLDDADSVWIGPSNRRRVAPNRLAAKLSGEARVAVGGEQLYRYRGGVYVPDGEAWARAQIAAILGDAWRSGIAAETVTHLYDAAPRLWEAPPLDKINCTNGILDLNTAQLEPHDPDFLSSVQIRAAYDPAACFPANDNFNGEVLPSDGIVLAREITGYLLISDPNSLQIAVIALGRGENGKSVWLRILTALLGGPANVSSVALHTLDEDRFAAADLYGKLANICADLDSRDLKSTAMFKKIVGGDLIRGERKFRPPFTFVPFSRLLFSANEAPPTSDSTNAFFRRWLIIPFDRTFSAGTADRNLLGKLTTPQELSGLLNHGLDALPGVMAAGKLSDAPSVAAAAAEFRVAVDSVAAFIDACCELGYDKEVAKPYLYNSYRSWCKDSNRRDVSRTRFPNRLRELVPALGEKTVRGLRYWTGIRVLPSRITYIDTDAF